MDGKKILKEIRSLDYTIACQESDMPTKLSKKTLIASKAGKRAEQVSALNTQTRHLADS